jgi:hypothetical protein
MERIQISLKSDKNIGYFTRRPIYIYDNISLSSSEDNKFCRESCRENPSTNFMFHITFPEVVPFMRLCGKMWYSQTHHRRQYNTTHALCMLDN